MHGELVFQTTNFKLITCFLECYKCPFEARILLKALGHCNFSPINLGRTLKNQHFGKETGEGWDSLALAFLGSLSYITGGRRCC